MCSVVWSYSINTCWIEVTGVGSATGRVPRMQPTKLGHLSLVNQGIDISVSCQDEYSILPYSFIIGVHGYVLVYSVTSLHR